MNLELVFSAIGVIIALISGAWTLLALAMKQFERRLDERFKAQDKQRTEARGAYELRFQTLEEENRQRERQHLELKAELPRAYVLREDYVRGQTVIEAKLDALALRFENMNLRGLARD